jgi:hypothetical protein
MICVTHVIDVIIYSCFYNGVNCSWNNVFRLFLFLYLYLFIKWKQKDDMYLMMKLQKNLAMANDQVHKMKVGWPYSPWKKKGEEKEEERNQ